MPPRRACRLRPARHQRSRQPRLAGAGDGAIKPNGDIDLRKVLRGVARNPTTLRALVSTGIDFNRALRTLRGCRGFLLGGEGLVAADL